MPGEEEEGGEKETRVSTPCWAQPCVLLPASRGAHCLVVGMHLKGRRLEAQIPSVLAKCLSLISMQRGPGTLRPFRSGPQQNNETNIQLLAQLSVQADSRISWTFGLF